MRVDSGSSIADIARRLPRKDVAAPTGSGGGGSGGVGSGEAPSAADTESLSDVPAAGPSYSASLAAGTDPSEASEAAAEGAPASELLDEDAAWASRTSSLRIGVCGLLLEQVQTMDKDQLQDVEGAFQPHTLLALVDHPCEQTRALLVQIISTLLDRCAVTFGSVFRHHHGFQVLSGQLRQNRPSELLVHAVFKMFTGCEVSRGGG